MKVNTNGATKSKIKKKTKRNNHKAEGNNSKKLKVKGNSTECLDLKAREEVKLRKTSKKTKKHKVNTERVTELDAPDSEEIKLSETSKKRKKRKIYRERVIELDAPDSEEIKSCETSKKTKRRKINSEQIIELDVPDSAEIKSSETSKKTKLHKTKTDGIKELSAEDVEEIISNETKESRSESTRITKLNAGGEIKPNSPKKTNKPKTETQCIEVNGYSKNSQEYKAREAWRKINPLQNTSLIISKQQVCNTIKLLREPKKKEDVFKKACKFHLKSVDIGIDSVAYLLKNIQYTILNRQWHNLPDLILLLIKHPGPAMKKFKNYVKEISYLNFLIHSEAGNEDILKQFYQLLYVVIPERKMKNFEVWHRNN